MNFKDIHIGSVIHEQVQLQEIAIKRICNFFGYNEDEIEAMYEQKSLDADLLLKWSKLLKYNLFLYYQNHLILYAPYGASIATKKASNNTTYSFRKNIYTQEIKDHMVNLVLKGGEEPMTVAQKYCIPKNTLYRWLRKSTPQEITTKKKNTVPKKGRRPEYKLIFQDLAQKQFGTTIPTSVQNKIEKLQNNLDILEVNSLIFNQKHSTRETAKMKVYDKESIEKILNIQQKEKLTNQEIASQFHVSRNSVAKWKKLYLEL